MARKSIELTEEEIQKILELASQGLGVREIAASLGMGKSTLDRKLTENSEAKEALDRGRASSDKAVINTAFQMATSGRNPNMTMFWLRTRCGWNDVEKAEPLEVKLAYSLS